MGGGEGSRAAAGGGLGSGAGGASREEGLRATGASAARVVAAVRELGIEFDPLPCVPVLVWVVVVGSRVSLGGLQLGRPAWLPQTPFFSFVLFFLPKLHNRK